MAQYRYQQQYSDHVRQQQMRLQNDRHDYNNDPYFYTAANYGYQEGFLAGQADRQDRWRSDYQNSYAYQDANYGYDGFYVAQDEYNYYFREGFRRGYEDGFYGRYQYGSYSSGKYTILGAILGSILDMESR